jgi:hypothetical protein
MQITIIGAGNMARGIATRVRWGPRRTRVFGGRPLAAVGCFLPGGRSRW